jgi:hypothetical protein
MVNNTTIYAGFLLIAWSGNAYLQDLHCLLAVKTNLCRICIAYLEWKEAVHDSYWQVIKLPDRFVSMPNNQ